MTWTAFDVPTAGVAGHVRGDGDQLAVVLHGGPGLTDYTQGCADEVYDGGDGQLRVARYQQRGQAPSSTEGPLTVAQLVEDLVAVIDHFGADRAIVVGHSWGGHLAMHAAVAAPERVAGLLLIDSLGAVGDGGAGTMPAVIGSRISAAAIAEIGALPTSDVPEGERGKVQLGLMWPGYFADPASAPPMPADIGYDVPVGGAIMSDAEAMLVSGELERKLAGVTVPSLHVIGRHSPIEPAANEKTAAVMPGAIVELLDTGHFPWIEQPGSITAATRRLLAAIAG
jgi:pimeloyl-ACP methyl ester carboxylesterase